MSDIKLKEQPVRLEFVVIAVILLFSPVSRAQENNAAPAIQELHFLVGTWEITFEIYDTHVAGGDLLFSEAGTQVCDYDLAHNQVPTFITCKGEVTSDRGRTRTFRESIRYSRFINAFERIGVFSNWPEHAVETVYFHPDRRTLELRGVLGVENGMTERYEDIYIFNRTYTSYSRRNVANFSDMPVTEFNLTLAGTATKID